MATEWLFAQLYPGHWSLLDRVVLHVIAPAAHHAMSAGADRWFFIRYIDRAGPHVRFRVRGDTDVINCIYGRWNQTLRAQLSAAIGGRDANPEILYAPYEPEIDKYGGVVGTGIAESAFQVSSEIALQLIAGAPTPDTRTLLAAHVMKRLASCVAALSSAEFWNVHHTFWTSVGVAQSRQSDHLPGQTHRFAAPEQDIAQPEPAAVLDRLAEATAAAIEAAAHAGIGLSAAHLLLHHMHMTVNRLGILPDEELRIAQTLRRVERASSRREAPLMEVQT